MGKPGVFVAVYNKGVSQKVGILEDTLMSEKNERERVGRLREANRVSAAGSIGAKASGVKCITLSSIKTLEDLTTHMEDLRDSETTLSQTMGTNLE
jgi:hypothetical protein